MHSDNITMSTTFWRQNMLHFPAKTPKNFPPKSGAQILGGPLGRACFGSFVAVIPPWWSAPWPQVNGGEQQAEPRPRAGASVMWQAPSSIGLSMQSCLFSCFGVRLACRARPPQLGLHRVPT